jgi:hypothetical protein
VPTGVTPLLPWVTPSHFTCATPTPALARRAGEGASNGRLQQIPRSLTALRMTGVGWVVREDNPLLRYLAHPYPVAGHNTDGGSAWTRGWELWMEAPIGTSHIAGRHRTPNALSVTGRRGAGIDAVGGGGDFEFVGPHQQDQQTDDAQQAEYGAGRRVALALAVET